VPAFGEHRPVHAINNRMSTSGKVRSALRKLSQHRPPIAEKIRTRSFDRRGS
jgi:hypothetical protein